MMDVAAPPGGGLYAFVSTAPAGTAERQASTGMALEEGPDSCERPAGQESLLFDIVSTCADA